MKEIITNLTDEEYQMKILGLSEPKEILKTLRESRIVEVSATPTSIRTRL